MEELEKVNARRALNEAQSFEQAQEIAQRLGQAEIRFDVKAGEKGVLFGSVTQTNLADAIWEKLKVRVDRRKIELDEPLKRIGRYQVPIELFADVTVETRVLVVPEGGELPPEEELQAIEEAAAAEKAAAVEAADRGGARRRQSRDRGADRGGGAGRRAGGREAAEAEAVATRGEPRPLPRPSPRRRSHKRQN